MNKTRKILKLIYQLSELSLSYDNATRTKGEFRYLIPYLDKKLKHSEEVFKSEARRLVGALIRESKSFCPERFEKSNPDFRSRLDLDASFDRLFFHLLEFDQGVMLGDYLLTVCLKMGVEL